MRAVKSPMISTATWPASWNCRSFRRTTACPSVRSGRLGSTPSLTRRGRPCSSRSSSPPCRNEVDAAARERRRHVGGHGAAMLPAHLPDPEGYQGYTRRDDPPALPPGGLHGGLDGVRCCLRRDLEDVPRRQLAQTSFVYAADDSVITAAPCGRGPRGLADVPDPSVDPRCGRRDRGPSLLPPPRHRRSRDPPRLLRELPRPQHRGGRLHDHPAAREEPLHRRRSDPLPEDERSDARLAAGGSAVQGRDPHALPEHGLFRQGRLRRAGGRPNVLRRRRGEARSRAVGAARRIDHEPRPLRPVRVSPPGRSEDAAWSSGSWTSSG